MSKAVLISIKPKWVAMILNGKKTIEVRKTAPKLETPFKVYVYCTNDKKYKIAPFRFVEGWIVKKFGKTTHYSNGCSWNMKGKLNGKVVAEFTCKEVEQYNYSTIDGVDIDEDTLVETRLSWEEINLYAKGEVLCGIKISDLKVYDQPKELSEFKYACRDDHACNLCKYLTVASWDKGNTSCGAFLRRPPQSWQYVEEI